MIPDMVLKRRWVSFEAFKKQFATLLCVHLHIFTARFEDAPQASRCLSTTCIS